MENRAHAVIAVTFLIVFSAGAVMIYYWLAQGPGEPRYYRIATSQSVGGLEVQSPVTFKGLLVGHVQTIGFDAQHPAKVEIVFSVQPDAMVTVSTYAVLQREGIVGGTALVLKLGEGSRARLETRRDAPARIPLRKSLLARIQNKGMESLSRINHILARMQVLLDKDNRKHLSAILSQLDQATRKLVMIEDRLLPVTRKLPALIASTQQALEQSQVLLTHASRLAESAQQPVEQIGETAETAQATMRQITQQMLPEIARLSDSLARTSQSLRELSQQLQANPESLIFGAPEPQPGPGEPGFGTGDAR